MLIVIEGIDGVGKTTVAMMLADRLNATYLKFPDRTTISGKEIAAHLTAPPGERTLSPIAFQALQHTNRVEHLAELVAACNSPTTHVVCDRYVASGIVYGELDGIDGTWLAMLADSLPAPDVNILLVGNLEHIEGQRLAGRDRELYERGGVEALRRQQFTFSDIWAHGRADGRWATFNSTLDTAQDIVQMILRMPRIHYGCAKVVHDGHC